METKKRALEMEHPGTLATRHNLAYTFHKQGRHEETIQLMEHVVKTRIAIIGENHPNTLASTLTLQCWRGL
jgi:hypothetical protein